MINLGVYSSLFPLSNFWLKGFEIDVPEVSTCLILVYTQA